MAEEVDQKVLQAAFIPFGDIVEVGDDNFDFDKIIFGLLGEHAH